MYYFELHDKCSFSHVRSSSLNAYLAATNATCHFLRAATDFELPSPPTLLCLAIFASGLSRAPVPAEIVAVESDCAARDSTNLPVCISYRVGCQAAILLTTIWELCK